ncbi:hypothetical protein P9112_010296 [Eukaryota sp. TZLM1-RC]
MSSIPYTNNQPSKQAKLIKIAVAAFIVISVVFIVILAINLFTNDDLHQQVFYHEEAYNVALDIDNQFIYFRDDFGVYPNTPDDDPFELILDVKNEIRYIKPFSSEGECFRENFPMRNRELQLKGYNVPENAKEAGEFSVGDIQCQLYKGTSTIIVDGTEEDVDTQWCVANRFLHMLVLNGTEHQFYYNHKRLSNNDDLFNPDKMCSDFIDI